MPPSKQGATTPARRGRPPKAKEPEIHTEALSDGIPGTMAHPEYVNGYQIGHQDGHTIGYAEGRAAGLIEAGDTDTLTEEAYDRGYLAAREAAERLLSEETSAAYQRGYQEAIESKRPPLFEAAKRVCEQAYDAPDDLIEAKLAEIQETYGEPLPKPDVNLLMGIVRRYRFTAEAQRQVVMATNRPKSNVGRQVARRLAEPTSERAETVYETVR